MRMVPHPTNYGSIVLLSSIIRILYFLIIWKVIPMQKMILNLKIRRKFFPYEEAILLPGICTFHFKEYIEQIFVYVMDHLSCFDDYYLLDFDDSQDTEFFYWDISNDTVILYIVGMTPDRFKKFFQTIYGDYKPYIYQTRKI